MGKEVGGFDSIIALGDINMSLRSFYRKILKGLENIPKKLEILKGKTTEEAAIKEKKNIYKDIHWSREQTKEFLSYWKKYYGKAIPSQWHKLYQATSGEYHVDYIPDLLMATEIEPLLNDYKYMRVLSDKSILETIIGMNNDVVVPKTICLTSGGRLFDSNRTPIEKKQLFQILESVGDVVVKPTVDSSSGERVVFKNFSKNITQEDVDFVIAALGADGIMQKKIESNEIFASFNSSSINTIRIITYIVEDKVFYSPLAFRIGRENSQVDNIHAGGISVAVNADGTLGKTAYEWKKNGEIKRHIVHPDHQEIVFEGKRLPCIDKIIKAAIQLHGKFPKIGLISWDFTVNNVNEVVVIETNLKGQSAWFLQITNGKPLFYQNTEKILSYIKEKRK